MAVDNALLVRSFQSRSDLAGVLNGRFHGDGPGKIGALYQLHDAGAFFDPVKWRQCWGG
jgi:hypothetical protein